MDMQSRLAASLQQNIQCFQLRSGNGERFLVYKLYEEILQRPPDREGLLDGCRQLTHEKKTIVDYCGVLSDSVEYEQRICSVRKHYKEVVQKAYSDILNREPDSTGLHYYTQMLFQKHMTPSLLLCLFRFSPEGRGLGRNLSFITYVKAMLSLLFRPALVCTLVKKTRGR